MTTRRARTGNMLAMRAEAGKQVDRIPASHFPVQYEIQHLQNELNAFNDRIIELENEGHCGHAMEVLKAKAIDFARQIDELRCLLVGPLPQGCGFRRLRPGNPIERGHAFRSKAATFSDEGDRAPLPA